MLTVLKPLVMAVSTILQYIWGGFSVLSSLCYLFAAWQLGHQLLGGFLLPAPLVVLLTAWDILLQAMTNEIHITLYRATLGVFSAIGVGIALGVLAGLSKTISLSIKPLITMLLATPPIAWVVLALFWLGMGNNSVIFTVFITCVPFTFASSMQGILSLDNEYLEMSKIYKIPILKQLYNIYLPHLVSYVFPAISVAIGMGIKITIMAELLGANDGIGAQIATSRSMLDTPAVLAYVVIVVGIVLLTESLIVEPLKSLLMPWNKEID